jgi:hypothetical protein
VNGRSGAFAVEISVGLLRERGQNYSMPALSLPFPGVRESFLAAIDELRAEHAETVIGRNFTHWGGRWSTPDGFAAYVAAVRAEADEETPRPAGRVPETTWWWVDGDE